MNISVYLKSQSKKVEKALDGFLPKATDYPPRLHQAMRYAVMSGGKRIRPILALAACEAVGGDAKDVMPAACALELIHNYSLVHDDLPCMDDDNLRRGRPTCHKKFDEETAVLAGDALLTHAFKILASVNGTDINSQTVTRRLDALRMIAEAVGAQGMVGGQAVDIEFQEKELDLPTIEYINTHKSGALIAVSTRIGAYLGGGTSSQVRSIFEYGKTLGLLFQIVDDIIDQEGYATLIGVSEAKRQAQTLLLGAKEKLRPLGSKAAALDSIADFVLTRRY